MEVIYMMTIIITAVALMVTLSILGEMDRRNKEAKEYEDKVSEGLRTLQSLNEEKIKLLVELNDDLHEIQKELKEGMKL